MRYTVSHLKVTENLPLCPACGTPTVFANAADMARDGRVYLIFRCHACPAGETKVWRPEYQAMADMLASDD
jgi:ribosomal protein S27AE